MQSLSGIDKLGQDVAEVKFELKGWGGWLRLVVETSIVTVGVTEIGIIIPLGFALWRQSY